MNNEVYLSVIIPAYNEEKRLPGTLAAVKNYLAKQNYSSEVIVVDADSSDRTPDIAREFSVKLLEVKNCRGKGEAIQGGMRMAQGRFRLFTDADNSTSIDQIKKMRPYFDEGYDVVIASRDAKGAILKPAQPFFRKFILGKGFRLLRKFIIGLWDIQDTQCGFKFFSEKASQNIFPKITIMGFSFDAEVLVLAKKFGYKIKEVPVMWVNNQESKVKPGHMVRMLLELVRIRLNLLKGLYD